MDGDPLTIGTQILGPPGNEINFPNGNISTVETSWVKNTERSARVLGFCDTNPMLSLSYRATDRQFFPGGVTNPCVNANPTGIRVACEWVDGTTQRGPAGTGIVASGQRGGNFIGGNSPENLGGTGVIGQSLFGNGADGNPLGFGVWGESRSGGIGVHGQTAGRPKDRRGTVNSAVKGVNTGVGNGVEGRAREDLADCFGGAFFGRPAPPAASFANSGALLIDGMVVKKRGAYADALPHPDGSERLLYSMLSPDSACEDFGRGELVEGRAHVELDPDFAAMLRIGEDSDYHIFLTPEGDSNGLYVSSRSAAGFEVREQQGGASSLTFSYRVVAKRKDEQPVRFARLEIPEQMEILPEDEPPRQVPEEAQYPPTPPQEPTPSSETRSETRQTED
jgi:hypothetical protein